MSRAEKDVRRPRRGSSLPGLLARALVFLALAAGLVLVLWASTVEELVRGPAQTERSWIAGQVFEGRQLGQSAKLRLEYLAAIRVWLLPPLAPGEGRLALQVRLAEPGAELGTVETAVADLSSSGPTTFWLPSLRARGYGIYDLVGVQLLLDARDVSRAEAASLAAGPNIYRDGALLIDGRPLPRADMAFETLYRTTLADRVLPISRIAAGRPGLLGWPPLYALVAYALLVACTLFLWRLFRLTRG